MSKYLVEIKTKAWMVPSITVKYLEVEAENEYFARHKAFEEFEQELKYKASARKLMSDNGLTISDIAASDAVQL